MRHERGVSVFEGSLWLRAGQRARAVGVGGRECGEKCWISPRIGSPAPGTRIDCLAHADGCKMSEKADHLIERAAALLRSASTTQLPEHPAEAPDQGPGLTPAMNGAAAAAAFADAVAAAPACHGGPTGLSPDWRPSARPRAALGASPPGSTTQTALTGAITSAADIPPSPLRPPISLETLERAGVMVARNHRTRVAEEYRIVIGRVLRALHEDPAAEARWEPFAPNVVMVTSARPGEGKSFTALNMAASIAQNAAESVLLVDLDAKIHSVSDEIGAGDRPGFMDLINDPALSPDDVVMPSELPHLAFMSLGNRVRRRGEDDNVDDSFDVRPITPAIHRISQRYPEVAHRARLSALPLDQRSAHAWRRMSLRS